MIARKTWQEVRWMTLVYLLLLELMLVAAVFYWPTLAEQLQRNPAMENLIPADFARRWFKAMKNPDDGVAYPAYMAIQQYFKGCNIVGIACAVLLGTGAFAGERENGTLEFLLSRPISRGRVLAGKVTVMAACVVLPIVLSSLSSIPLSWCIDRDLPLLPTLLAAAHASLFVVAFLLLTVAVSVVMQAQVHVAFAVGGFVVVQVGIYFVQVLRQGSVFRLADFEMFAPIMAGNTSALRLFLGTDLWLLLACVAIYLVSHLLLRRRDL